MEQIAHTPEVYDYRRHDRIWQRVGPTLEPYPANHVQENVTGGGEAAAEHMALRVVSPRQEGMLPGAEVDPCCMGSAAADMLGVLTGFIEEALSDQRHDLALSRQAPVWARQRLRDLAAEEGGHAKRLMAVYYLITGECYQPQFGGERIYTGRWCPALRQRYHAEACSGLNYARAADGTTDPCLRTLLQQLSDEEYRHAEVLLRLLERSLQGQTM